ncbi:hypothetical protein SJ_197 [Proteus phage SJ_PmiM]|nr:hypothetical protein SJ_197 [Proteus phage SJ_PmiM]
MITIIIIEYCLISFLVFGIAVNTKSGKYPYKYRVPTLMFILTPLAWVFYSLAYITRFKEINKLKKDNQTSIKLRKAEEFKATKTLVEKYIMEKRNTL